MEENTNFLSEDAMDTTPEAFSEEENITNDEENIVTPDDSETIREDVVRDTETQTAQKSVSENKTAEEPFVSVQYNHKLRNFTKEEAVNLIQKGMHTEALRGKLEYLAKTQGTDINSLVEKMITAPENAYKDYLERIYGKGHENVDIGMKIYREKRGDEYKKIMSEMENSVKAQEKIKNVNSRLADEYLELKNQFPDAPQYCDLPDSVIVEAAQGKRDLYSAYLCYLHKEKQKIDAANKAQKAANAASSGKMSNTEADVMSSVDRGFLSGLWGR